MPLRCNCQGGKSLPFVDIRKLKGFEREYRLRVGNLWVLFTKENDIITINNILREDRHVVEMELWARRGYRENKSWKM